MGAGRALAHPDLVPQRQSRTSTRSAWAAGVDQRLSALRGLNLGGRWSPDGRQIAVTLEFDGNPEVAILNPDGSLRAVSPITGRSMSPRVWSPDGTQLVFCSDRSGSPQIYVMGADGSGVRRISNAGRYNTSPAWAPKGDRIAYATRADGRFQIVTVKTDGSDARQVTHGRQQRGSELVAGWAVPRLQLEARRRSENILSDLSGANQAELTTGEGSDRALRRGRVGWSRRDSRGSGAMR